MLADTMDRLLVLSYLMTEHQIQRPPPLTTRSETASQYNISFHGANEDGLAMAYTDKKMRCFTKVMWQDSLLTRAK